MDHVVWVTWTAKGRDLYSNPRAKMAHATVNGDLASVGDFPLLCGRMAPDAWDADIRTARGARSCRACLKALKALGPQAPVPAAPKVETCNCQRLGETGPNHGIFCPLRGAR